MESSTEYYSYSPLQSDSLRLIQFEQFEPEIRISLHHYKEDQAPVYFALSYAWGTEPNSKDIICDGRRLTVTQHLQTGMRRIFDTTRCSRLWVDAICIDQTSGDEKAAQVAKMHHIYQKATGVYIWLGDGDDGSEKAMEAIRNVTIPATFAGDSIEDIQKTIANYRKDAPQLFDASMFRAIATLGRNAWFRRLWTAQEYFYGKSASFFCGNVVVDGSKLLGTFQKISIYSFGPTEPASWMEEEDLFAGFRALMDLDKIKNRDLGKSSPSFFDFVTMGRGRFCKEPVDRIYALFGMAENTDKIYTSQIQIDYSEDARINYWRVFNQFGKIAIQHEPHLALLSVASSQERHDKILSWCPDLAFREYLRDIDPVNVYAAGWPWANHEQEREGAHCLAHKHFVGKDANHASTSPDTDVLSIWGASLGRITSLGPLKTWDGSVASEDIPSVQTFARDLLDWFIESEKFCRGHVPDNQNARGLWNAILVGETNKIRRKEIVATGVDEDSKDPDVEQSIREEPGAEPLDIEQPGTEEEDTEKTDSKEPHSENSEDSVYLLLISILFKIADLDPVIEWESQDSELLQLFQTLTIWISAFEDDWENRVLFATDNGYIGYAAEAVRLQDTVCILYGGRPLYVLRTEGTGYRLVSDAYGHKLVNGEVFELLDQGLVVEEEFMIS